jgi:hypothetical protein
MCDRPEVTGSISRATTEAELVRRRVAAEGTPREAATLARRLRVLVAAVAASSLLVSAGVASADVACGNTGGTICCGSQVWLPIRNVAVSYWSGFPLGLHYYARRQNSSGELTYNHYQYNGGNWSFDNGVDVYRGTGIYRGGQPYQDFAISQVSHTSC